MEYDVLIIGGGITGAGALRDCALRGLKAICIEKATPGQATTAASTHLIHGGIRYLLYDRLTTHTTAWDAGNIVRIAGDMLHRTPILWPLYKGQQYGPEIVETLIEAYAPFQRMKGGLKHLRLNATETAKLLPGIRTEGLLGGISFDEYWLDAEGLVQRCFDAAQRHGGKLMTHAEVTGLIIDGQTVKGVRIKELVKGESEIHAKVVLNAAGPWVDKITRMGGIKTPLRLRKGTHLVYNRRLFETGMLLEAVDRGRYIFVVPFPGGTLVGPTDLDTKNDPDHLRTDEEEIKYLLASMRRYFPDFPEDFSTTTVGARPILGQEGNEKLLSREYDILDHALRHGLHGFTSIAGGKLSDFRLMSKDAVDVVCAKLGRTEECTTHKTTLDDQPVENIPDFPRAWRPLKKFLRNYPRLRELYSLAFLGMGLVVHTLRRLRGRNLTNAGEFRRHYGLKEPAARD
jgi:glycerol-3-phosphate dehydrogenase